MRFVALAIILASLPLFISWLQSREKNRDVAVLLVGLLVFAGGELQTDAAIITWPAWLGTTRGIVISPVDTLAIALLATRKGGAGKGLPFTGLMAAYLAVLVASIAYSPVPMASAFSGWSFARVFLVFLALGGELSRPGAFLALARGLSIGLIVQAGYVIQQKLTGVAEPGGTMGHRNVIGMMVELTFPILLAAMLEGERDRLLRLGALASLLIVAAGGSRAAMALVGGGAAVLIVLSLIRKQTPGKVAIAGAAALTLVAAVPIGLMTLKSRFGEGSLITEETARAAMANAARAIASDHPLGVGANVYVTISNTGGYAARAGVPWGGSTMAAPVHNAYLLARSETGYHGEGVFILLLLVPTLAGLVHAFRHRRTQADGWALGSAVAVGALAIHSNVEYNTAVYGVQLPLALNLAVIAMRIRAARVEKTAQLSDAEGSPAVNRRAPRVARLPQVPVMGPLTSNSSDAGRPSESTQEIRQ